MIILGDFNELEVLKKTSFGYYLRGEKEKNEILLPNASLNGNEVKVGEKVRAFIYRDSSDRIIATLKEPYLTIGNIGYLTIKSVNNIGAFADIGLERDVLIPKKEQKYTIHPNRKYLLYLYEDKTGRLAATTDIDRYLDFMEEPSLGMEVKGIVYGYQTNNALMVAIDGKYKGVVLPNEYFIQIRPGDEINFRIKKIYEDGKLGLTPRAKKLDERKVIEEKILKYLENHDGFMPLNDKSNPEDIKKTFNTSKNYFKMALGGLMKQKLVKQDEFGTYLIKN